MEELTVTTALEKADADAARINSVSVRRLFDPDDEENEEDDEKDDEDD